MISEESFKSLKPGNKVRIVSSWPSDRSAGENNRGEMDCWLGKTMTVKGFSWTKIRMVEDNGRWIWNRHAIAAIGYDTLVGIEEFI